MEEIQSPTTQINGEEEIGDDFYEKIEAPKFVDLTAPDRYRPDNYDRHWFCLRVGCDQKHEEEMDSEAIYKNFVLRVMAARSPNIRLRKALYREDNSKNLKCPLTVPAKSSKSRISRLAMISSISQKVVDGKPKVRAPPKLSATPNAKAKQSSIVAKALTTPRNKKRLSNPDAFRSVRNPKPTTVAVPKNRVVAKALVFHSPKKTVKIKTSVELKSSVKMLCSGMKKLGITSGKKPLPLDASRKQFRGREVKSRVFDSLHSQNHKGKEAKSSKCLKKKNKEKDLQQCLGPVPREDIENDSIDMEIDEKSRNGSLEACSTSVTLKSNEGNGNEEGLILEPHLHQNNVEALSEALRSDMTSLSSAEERNSSKDGNENNEGSDHEEKCKSSPEKERIPVVMENDVASASDDKANDGEEKERIPVVMESDVENALASDDKANDGEEKERIPIVMESDVENALASDDKANDGEEKSKSSPEKERVPKVMESDVENALASDDKANDGEVVDSDDKENCSASDENRELKLNDSHMAKKKILGKHETSKSTLKVTRLMRKPAKENSTAAPSGTQGLKYRKPKPTNPKPFRLRTDERGILKEANLEKKLHQAPLREIPDGTLNDQSQRVGISGSKTSKGEEERKSCTTPLKRAVSTHQKINHRTSKLEHNQDNAPKKSEANMKRTTKSPLMKQLARPRGVASCRKGMVSLTTPGQLGVIEETSTKILRPKEAAKPNDCGAFPTTKATTPRSSSRGRRPPTIAKEPNFHSIHVPKSCTKKLA